jgi:ABC-type uncharacterized transport system ATPase subunit
MTTMQEERQVAEHEIAAVQAERLVKHYPGKEVVEAVKGVDLRIEAGEIFGFLGPNGAGKSTTVRMLTTLLSITSGTARVAGIDVARDPDAARRRMASCSECRAPRRTTGPPSCSPSSSSRTPPTAASRATAAA